jgi:hypothetical protein
MRRISPKLIYEHVESLSERLTQVPPVLVDNSARDAEDIAQARNDRKT